MKLVFREYLASLRERGELDAILPDLLSEIGFNVISKPKTGPRQYGVDIAAVGPDELDEGKKKLFLFSVKSGDLNRQGWDGTPQALRSSLNEILDVYIPTHVASKYRKLDIVVCICMGGDLLEPVRLNWQQYCNEHETSKISFAEWNGDKLAELLAQGILGRELLDKSHRSLFQKSVAMVDQPDISYRYFVQLLREILLQPKKTKKETITSLRQVYICLWVIYVWARDVDNLEAPFRMSEIASLYAWHVAKQEIGEKSKSAKNIFRILDQICKLHLIISEDILQNKIVPHSDKLHALSAAVASGSSVDVNLALFEQLGRVGLNGLWCFNLSELKSEKEQKQFWMDKAHAAYRTCITMINNNPALLSPLRDDHAIEISILLLLGQACGQIDRIRSWVSMLAERCIFSIRIRGKYPTTNTDYADLIDHPRDGSNEYFQEATCASVLYPLLAVWLAIFEHNETLGEFSKCVDEELDHCTLQLWLPDTETDDKIWIGERDHGKAVPHLPIQSDSAKLFDTLETICRENREINSISANAVNLWPLFITACRHYRMPLPPQFWTMFMQNGEK